MILAKYIESKRYEPVIAVDIGQSVPGEEKIYSQSWNLVKYIESKRYEPVIAVDIGQSVPGEENIYSQSWTLWYLC